MTSIRVLQGEEIVKDLKRRKKAQDDMEKEYEELVKGMDKTFEKHFGKMCPDFEPGCAQCSAHLIYNNFKRQLWEAFVK